VKSSGYATGLRRAVRRTWTGTKRLRAGLPEDSIFGGCNDDRYQARVALYFAAARLADKRRVLDLSAGTGLGAEPMLKSGAQSYLGLTPSTAAQRYAEKHHPGAFRSDHGIVEPETFDLLLAIEDNRAIDSGRVLELCDRFLGRGSVVVLGAGAYSGEKPSQHGNYLSDSLIAELERRYLSVERWRVRAPNGYVPDWRACFGGTGRAQDYRVEHLARQSGDRVQAPPASNDSANRNDDPAIAELAVATLHRSIVEVDPLRLHIGSGLAHLEGWLNVDLRDLPGVDLIMDITETFPFDGVDTIYAEHFIEHLTIDHALRFLENAWLALKPGGRLRLSTPNLDWVWSTHYQPEATGGNAIAQALRANRAFYGWQHRFLWNRELLAKAIRACGFDDLSWPVYGESRWSEFRGIERHEAYDDTEDLRHILIVEAEKGEQLPAQQRALAELREHIYFNFGEQVKEWDAIGLASDATQEAAHGAQRERDAAERLRQSFERD
jgi:predicted SAM-dependent methyltransferase